MKSMARRLDYPLCTAINLHLCRPLCPLRRLPEPSLILSLFHEIYGKETRLSSPHKEVCSFSTANIIKKERIKEALPCEQASTRTIRPPPPGRSFGSPRSTLPI
ncbi:hypothetical protein KSP40_PGU011505 [Platanthera guangdongensis]|uniref:Uncharacterized protein n=1 Tax=Platanthera guangdongensis TaxID=2320717 RepID=A0ABR2N5Y1_9ASPA